MLFWGKSTFGSMQQNLGMDQYDLWCICIYYFFIIPWIINRDDLYADDHSLPVNQGRGKTLNERHEKIWKVYWDISLKDKGKKGVYETDT